MAAVRSCFSEFCLKCLFIFRIKITEELSEIRRLLKG